MSVEWHRRRSDQQLKISILEGRGSRMPAFHGKLGDDQVGDIVAFLRSLAPGRGRIAIGGAGRARTGQLR